MRVVGRHLVDAFMPAHADARPALRAWLAGAEAAAWDKSLSVLADHPRASIVGEGLAVFRLKGNDYRLAARIDFSSRVSRVPAIGTHGEHDNWSL